DACQNSDQGQLPFLPRSDDTVSPDELIGGAYDTYLNARGVDPAAMLSGIPPEYWADSIRRLDPIRVYMHEYNIVIVQSQNDGVEEGKYVLTPISSYLPRSGDDGFVFTPYPTVDDGAEDHQVFDFRRTVRD
ncbi:MAG: hypothetical protein JW936_09130, partial [Sedimentisphaerales bacterium]|nr:hypothetical protein [Sedimentisphaerales bacterium]